jgi:phage terminase large subunit-like protein
MSNRTKDLIFMLIIIAVTFTPLIYFFNKQHTEGREKCDAVQGVWFDREMKCIVGTDLREVK